jgi:single-strand DNA-binding protein
VVVWGKQADVVEKYLDKGMQVAVSGKITYRNYDDKDGNKKYITEIIASDFLMLDKKN